MSDITAFLSRYRWELAPLLAVAFARLAATVLGMVFDGSRSLPVTLVLATVLLLAIALPRIRHEGRPLLTVLWRLVILTELVFAGRMILPQLLMTRLG